MGRRIPLIGGLIDKLRKSNDHLDNYRSNFPDFWHDFVRYVASTQVNPDTKENLESRFNNNPQITGHLTEIGTKGYNVGDILNDCIRELGGRYVARGDNDTSSIVSGKQLPRVNLPSGGDYDIPLYDLLIKNGASKYQAIRTYNALKSHISSKDAGVLINVGGTVPAVLQGDSSTRNSILTVGGAKEFIHTYGLFRGWIHGLGEKGYNILMNSLNSVK